MSSRLLSPSESWRAVLERDPTFDGRVYYGVRTTGIFCRPSCPARKPKRENVTFFASPESAEAGGFRPCKRCGPGARSSESTDRAIAQARAFLDANLDERVTLLMLAREVDLSPHHLQRTFERRVGLSPKAYQDAMRLQRMKRRLRSGDTVSRASIEAGFGSSRAAYEKAAAGLGMTPGTYRKGAPDITIRYAWRSTRFGPVMAAATPLGICSVGLARSVAALRSSLEKEFPRATLTEDRTALAPSLDAIVANLNGDRPDLDVPTDLSGTDFQMRVWKALREIPRGETRTYGEVASGLGMPSAARAVALACAANRVALVVPCHRVVRSDGKEGGYRWGAETKQRLLRAEAPEGR